jgi:hypothetical protein
MKTLKVFIRFIVYGAELKQGAKCTVLHINII